MTVWVTMVTVAVLSAMKLNGFCAHTMISPFLTSKTNATAALLPTTYVTGLDASTEASSLYITTKCATSSCTFLNKPPPLPACAENPASTRATADQRRIYVRRGVAWRQEVTLSYEAYDKSRLTP